MNLRAALAILLSFAVTLAVGCAPQSSAGTSGVASQPAVSGPKRIVAAINGSTASIYNRLRAGLGTATGGAILGAGDLEQLVNSGLTLNDTSGAPRPLMAEAVPSIENGLWKLFPDGTMETTWKLRAGAKWHDGTPINTEHLLFTTKLDQDRNMPWALLPAYPFVQDIQASDARTLTVRWKSTYTLADQFLQNVPLPKHLLEADYENLPTDSFLTRPFFYTEWVGTGPFKLNEFVRDSHVVLSAFDGYVLGRPKIDEIEVKMLVDPNGLTANILAGTVELTLGRNISLEQGLAIEDRLPQVNMKMAEDYAGWKHLYTQHLNPTPPLITNVQYKIALVQGIDRQLLVDELQAGKSSIAWSIIGPQNVEYPSVESSIVRYPYDPRRAEQIITGLGYAKGGDGMFRDATGNTIGAWLSATDDSNQKIALSIQTMWKTIGIDAQQEVIPPALKDDTATRANFKSFSVQSGGEGPAGVIKFHSMQARVANSGDTGYPSVGGYRGNNYNRYVNLDLDPLIDHFQVELSFPARMEVLKLIIGVITRDVADVGLFWQVTPTFVSNRIANVIPYTTLGTHTWNSNQWDVR